MATPDIGKAWEYLQETTVGYKKLAVKPPTDKNSYWYKALVELGIIEAEEPPVGMGAALRAAFPPLTGLPVTDDAEKPSRGSVVLCDGSNAGGKHFKNVRRVGGSNDGYKIAGGAHDVRFDLCDASDIGVASQSMAWNFQRAPRNVQIYGGVAHNIGHTTRDHIAYVGGHPFRGPARIRLRGVRLPRLPRRRDEAHRPRERHARRVASAGRCADRHGGRVD